MVLACQISRGLPSPRGPIEDFQRLMAFVFLMFPFPFSLGFYYLFVCRVPNLHSVRLSCVMRQARGARNTKKSPCPGHRIPLSHWSRPDASEFPLRVTFLSAGIVGEEEGEKEKNSLSSVCACLPPTSLVRPAMALKKLS